MIRVHSAQMLGACLALGAAQICVSLRFLLRRLQERPAGAAAQRPSALVVVPCCGVSEGFDGNVRALLSQDYAGRSEYVFVAPSREDPAWARLREILPPSDPRVRLLASGETPARCSGKSADVLFALRQAPPGSEVLVFADSDLRVRPDWLASLIAPLSQPRVGAATSLMLYRPLRPSPASLLRMAWMAAGIPYLELLGVASGQSIAMRRRDFEELHVAELWSRSLLEDLALYPLLRKAAKKVAFVGRAMSVSREGTGLAEFLALTNKWMLAFKVYVPLVWILGFLTTLAKAYILFWALRPPVSWGLLALLFGLDAANLALLSQAYRACLDGERTGRQWAQGAGLGRWALLLAPVLQLVYIVNFLSSLAAREVRWGRYRYRLDGPQDVSAAPL